MKNAFIVIALVLVASTAFASHATQTKSKLQKINANAFGRSILQAIQVELKTSSKEDPRPRILEVLGEIEQEILSAQSEADQSNQNSNADLGGQVSDLEAQLADTEEKVAEWEDQQDQWTTGLENAQQLLQSQSDLLAALTEQRDTLVATREQQQAAWEHKNSVLQNTLDVIGEVRAVIADRIATRYDEELIETSHKKILSRFNDVKDTIHSKNFKKLTPGFSKMMAFVAAKVEVHLSQDSYQDVEATAALTTVVSLLDGLTQQKLELQTSLREVNEAQQADFDEVKAGLDAAIADATSKIDNVSNVIVELEGHLSEVGQELASASASIDSWTEQVETITAQLNNLNAAYAQETHDRTEELSIIQEVVEIVQNELSGLRDWTENRVASN